MVNKNVANDLTAQLSLNHFALGSSTATVYQFGKSNDLNNTDFTLTTLSGVCSAFQTTFPSYSMTVIDLATSLPPYAIWKNNHFTSSELATPNISGDLADPDGDGVPNLLEYALNLDPQAVSSAGRPAVSTMIQNGNKYLALTYAKLKTATGLNYIVEISSDMTNWSNGTNYTADVASVDQGATQLVTTRDLTVMGGPVARRFIRLRVTR